MIQSNQDPLVFRSLGRLHSWNTLYLLVVFSLLTLEYYHERHIEIIETVMGLDGARRIKGIFFKLKYVNIFYFYF